MIGRRVLVLSIVGLLGLHATRPEPTRSEPTRPELGTDTLAASFDGDGASLSLGTARASIGAVAFGRGDVRAALESGVPVAAGAHEVRESRGRGVLEWWREVDAGLEHGLTLLERPSGAGPLVVDVAVTDLEPRARDEDTIELARNGEIVATYAGLTVFDARGARIPSHMRVSGGLVSLVVDDEHARYPLVIDPLITAQEASLRPSDAVAQDAFGSAVAFSADATRAVIGADRDMVGAVTEAGSARVWRRSGTAWVEEATLVATEGASLDFHGSAVALTADASVALIGASGDFTPSVRTGSVRVFSRAGTAWTRTATLIPSDGGSDGFGQAVAITPDGSRALIGAPTDSTASAVNSGSGRVFLRTGSTWSEEATLIAPDAGAADYLGGSVAISADGTRAILSASNDSTSSGPQWGSVRVFVRTGTSWAYETGFEPVLRGCGRSVALSADGSRLLIGCATGLGTPSPGGVYVYVRTGTSWSQEALLTAMGGAGGDYFGSAVAVSADGTRAVIGARSDDVGGNADQGSARVFSRRGTTWLEEATLLAPDGAASDEFGGAIALSADGSRAIFGVPRDETPSGLRAGTARVFTIVGSNGSPCEGDAACSSGFCALGMCCSTRCGEACEACSAALTGGTDGTCGPYTAAAAIAVICRDATSSCDAPDACTPTSSACPSDGLAAPGTVCRPIASACDVAETCSGTSAACPSDAFEGAGVPCRLAATGCDAVEVCAGTGPACPADLVIGAGTVCRAAAGACDAEEACDGVSPACPGDARLPSGVSCGTGVGACSTPGICDGASTSCPGGTPLPLGTMCRAAEPSRPCDIDDVCDGVSDACPSRYAPVSTVCGAAVAGACDAPDHCAGTSADCLPTFLSAIECRPASGSCDSPELCPGDTPSCPPDIVEAAGQVCRASTNVSCDPDETCDGASTTCPADMTSCTASDGGTPTDASDSDGGAPAAATGCACRAGQATRSRAGAGALLALVLVLYRRRRR